MVRDGKGAKDRMVMLPASLTQRLRQHLRRERLLHEEDFATGYGAVYLPFALQKKYPNAPQRWTWQYVSPAR